VDDLVAVQWGACPECRGTGTCCPRCGVACIDCLCDVSDQSNCPECYGFGSVQMEEQE
jgi:hypothetical protein